MEMRISWLLKVSLMLMAVATLVATNSARADEKEETMKLADLPAQVREAVKLATAGGDIEKIELSTEDGKKVYEIEVEVEGGTVELVFNGSGQLIGIEVAETERDEEADDDDDEVEHAKAKSDKPSKAKKSDSEDDEGDDEDERDEEHGSEVVKKLTIADVP